MIDPTDDVTQDALRVVVEFGLLLFGTPVGVGGHGNMQNVVESGTASTGEEFLLSSEHIDLVIVGGVQRGRSW